MKNKFLPKIILKIGFIFLQDALRLKSCKNKISILNKIIEEFCRTELKLIEEDRQMNELISSINDNTSTPFIHNAEPINIPMTHDHVQTDDDLMRL